MEISATVFWVLVGIGALVVLVAIGLMIALAAKLSAGVLAGIFLGLLVVAAVLIVPAAIIYYGKSDTGTDTGTDGSRKAVKFTGTLAPSKTEAEVGQTLTFTGTMSNKIGIYPDASDFQVGAGSASNVRKPAVDNDGKSFLVDVQLPPTPAAGYSITLPFASRIRDVSGNKLSAEIKSQPLVVVEKKLAATLTPQSTSVKLGAALTYDLVFTHDLSGPVTFAQTDFHAGTAFTFTSATRKTPSHYEIEVKPTGTINPTFLLTLGPKKFGSDTVTAAATVAVSVGPTLGPFSGTIVPPASTAAAGSTLTYKMRMTNPVAALPSASDFQ